MKRNMMKTALAICALAIGGSAAHAQTVSLETYDGSLVVERFGVENGRVVAYGRLVPSSTVISSVDHSALGSWTGIGTGYGESGVESRSNMTSDFDGPTTYSLVRPSGDGLDIWMGATPANDRTSLDVRMGATSANDRTEIDASFGPTSGNDRTSIDLQMGPTSGNDRVAGGPIDLQMGPTSGNDRTSLDVRMGPTSGNDRTEIDASFGPTSGNDRTSIDMSVGATSGNDRVAGELSLSSSSSVIVPVSIVSASCDAVSLSFGGSSPVIVSSSSIDRAQLCAVSEAHSSGSSLMLSQELNRLVVDIR